MQISICGSVRAIAGVVVALSLAGCGSTTELLGGMSGAVTGYSAGNAFSPLGYRSKEIDETHHTVIATGTATTPRARLEKIATIRAAEIGKEGKLGFFKIDSVQPAVECGKKVDGYKGPSAKQSDYTRVVVAASYAKTATDPSYQPTDATFDRLTAELQADVVAPDASAAAAQEVAAACGKK